MRARRWIAARLPSALSTLHLGAMRMTPVVRVLLLAVRGCLVLMTALWYIM